MSPPQCLRTRPPRGPLAAASLLLALGAIGGAAPQQPPPQELATRMAAAIEPRLAQLSRESPRYEVVRDGWVTKSSMQLFRHLNPELFSELGNLDLPSGAGLDRCVRVIADVRQQLSEHGVELLVIPLPERANIYPEVWVEIELAKDFRGCAPGLARFNERLREAGVEVLDLLPALTAERASFDRPQDQLVFLRANGHWSPKGARIAARAIADNVRAREWFTAPTGGSAQLESFSARWKPNGEVLAEGAEVPVLTFERVVTPSGSLVSRTSKHSPIVLWGDSFTVIFKAEGADLPRRLHHLLGEPVDVIASQGAGPDTARISFARRGNALDGKRLVVWAFAARSLMRSDWEQVRLQRAPR